MPLHYFKRTPTGVKKSRIALFGPLDANWRVPDGQQPQRLKFNLSGGTVAKCNLTPGQAYAIYVEMYCERGAKLKCETQPGDLSSPPKTVANIAVPANYNGPKTQLGYAYADIRYFTA
ncbi:MAG: hypothetical protein SXU28_09960 [Pseudomonadota bacterium]|nr:hypothetical protein [Pseudomonadota bacterium]